MSDKKHTILGMMHSMRLLFVGDVVGRAVLRNTLLEPHHAWSVALLAIWCLRNYTGKIQLPV